LLPHDAVGDLHGCLTPDGSDQACRDAGQTEFSAELLVARVYQALFNASQNGLLLCILPFFRVNFGWGLAWFRLMAIADIVRAHVA
jgi:hypothetical protein